MSTSGQIKTLFSNKEKTEALFPRTKTTAVSDDAGVGLNVLLDDINTALGTKASESYVQAKIAEAELSGGDVDLTGYATLDDLSNKVDKTTLVSTSSNGLMSAADKTKLDGITASADSVSFSRSLTSGTKVGTITINGTGTDLYAPTNTDTHYTTGIRAGGSGTATNATATNPYIKVLDNTTYRSQIRLVGGGATTVSSDGSGNVTISSTNTTYSAATTSAAGLMSAADKVKLNGIATGANAYSLPTATSSTLGGVKIGSNITVSSGTISLTSTNIINALGYTPASSSSSGSGMTRVLGAQQSSGAYKIEGNLSKYYSVILGSGSYRETINFDWNIGSCMFKKTLQAEASGGGNETVVLNLTRNSDNSYTISLSANYWSIINVFGYY